jgi:hypothetical protein
MRTRSTGCEVCWETGVWPLRLKWSLQHLICLKGCAPVDDATHVGQDPGAVDGALVLAGDLVELEGGVHAVAAADGPPRSSTLRISHPCMKFGTCRVSFPQKRFWMRVALDVTVSIPGRFAGPPWRRENGPAFVRDPVISLMP